MIATYRLRFALIALLAACQQGSPPVDREVESPPQPVQGDARHWLTADGWGDLRIGMTREESVALLGEDANPTAVGGPDPEQCDQFRPQRAPDGMLLMFEQGRLTRISLSAGAALETEGGIAVGDSAGAVRTHFAAKVVASPHKYWPSPAEYLAVWTVRATDSSARGIVYEIGEDGRVVQIHAGGGSIQYVEGCL